MYLVRKYQLKTHLLEYRSFTSTRHDPSRPASNLLETGLVSSCNCRHTWPCKVPMGQRGAHHKLLLTGSPVVLRNNKCMQSQPAYTYHTIRSTMDPYIYIILIHYKYICITDISFCLKFLHWTKSDSLGRKRCPSAFFNLSGSNLSIHSSLSSF